MARAILTAFMMALAMVGTGAASGLTPEQETEIRASVDLFRALERCRVSGPFEEFGLGAGGPCAEWSLEFRALRERQNGLVILQAGYECLAGDLVSYASTFFGADRDLEWRDYVQGLFEDCEAALP